MYIFKCESVCTDCFDISCNKINCQYTLNTFDSQNGHTKFSSPIKDDDIER